MVEQVRLRRINRPKPTDWQSEPGRFWVYVIRSESTGRLYVGHTNDLDGRVRQHNNPETNRSLHTKRNCGPWRLVHFEEFASRGGAMARERFLKSGQGREWLKAATEEEKARG
jgi:putative endonuclease